MARSEAPQSRWRCPRRRATYFSVVTQRLPGGERLPTVIDNRTGVPPRLALRWALKRRHKMAAGTLALRLRDIASLYDACDRDGLDLDALLLRGNMPTIGALSRAAEFVDRRGETGDPAVVGHLRPDDRGKIARRAVRHPGPHNRRVSIWKAFLKWALEPAKWRGGAQFSVPSVEQERRIRTMFDSLDVFLEDELQPVGSAGERLGLRPDELAVIEDVLTDPAVGGLAPHTRERAYLMYLVARWGGLRLGELLNLHVEDIAPWSAGQAYLQVVRRHDDPDDVREQEPHVKRAGSKVRLPDDLHEALREYIDRRRGSSPYPDLFLAQSGEPLSYSRASAVMRQVRELAVVLYETTRPGSAHTLAGLGWHRLRHTRAREMLPLLVDLNKKDRPGMDDFLRFFRWRSVESAEPYISELLDASADIAVAEIVAPQRALRPKRND